MTEDKITERHAQILAHDYNLSPNVTKCERALRVGEDICSMFLADTSNSVRCLVGYGSDDLKYPHDIGDPCNSCWSVGKLWEDEDVPRFAHCTLSGFSSPVEFLNTVYEPGIEMKSGTYKLEQTNAPVCTYEYLDDDVEIIWTPDDVLSTILVTTKPDNIVRMDAGAGGCYKVFEQNGSRADISCC